MWTRLSGPPTPDVAWLLYAAGVLRDGGVLGVDVVENSPPIIFWLKVPVLALGAAIGLAPWSAWVAFLVLASLCSASLIHRLSSESPREAWLGPLAAAVFLLLPGRDFGQREHVALILTVPWLIVIARRLEGRPARGEGLWMAIVLAAVGLGIKPHFVLVWLSVAGLLITRTRSIRVLLRPELVTIPVLLGAEVVAVALFHPSYFEHLRTYGRTYVGFLAIPPWQALFIGVGPAVVLFAWLARVALRGTRDRDAEDTTALLMGAFGFWLAAALQLKGWSYHYLPATGIALLAVGALLAATAAAVRGLAARTYRAAGVGVLGMALLTPVIHAVLQVTHVERQDHSDLDPNLDRLLPVVRAAAKAGPVFVFSTNLGSNFPLVSEAGAQWAFRHPSLLMLGAAYSEQLDGVGPVRPRPFAERTAAERRIGIELAADLQRYRPATLLVLRQDVADPGWGGAKRFDYLDYFRADPWFAWFLADYGEVGVIGDYALYFDQRVSVAVPSDRVTGASRIPGASELGTSRVRWRVDPVALLIFGLSVGAAGVLGRRARNLSKGY